MRKNGNGKSRSEGCSEDDGGDGCADAGTGSRSANDEHVEERRHTLGDDRSAKKNNFSDNRP